MVKLLVLTFFFFAAINSIAQSKIFYSVDNAILEQADSSNSYYYQIIPKQSKKARRNDETESKPTIAFYTKTKTVYYNDVATSATHSTRTYYYPNGKLKFSANFDYGSLSGPIISYYESGAIKSELVFEPYDPKLKISDRVIGIIQYNDSTGKVLIDKGNGICHCDLNPITPNKFIESGIVKNGLKVGQWTGKAYTESYSFTEAYKEGHLVRGMLLSDSVKYNYTVTEVPPSYPGDLPALYQFIGQNILYPASARRSGVEGSVYVSFIIDVDGKLMNPKVVKGVGGDIDDEAVRVVSLIPPWTPGRLRGKSVKVRFTLPLKFKLK